MAVPIPRPLINFHANSSTDEHVRTDDASAAVKRSAPEPSGKTVVHFINNLAAIGGAERLVLDLAACAPVRPVTVITWYGRDNSLLQFDTHQSVRLIALRPFKPSALLQAIRAIKRADVLHLHLFPTLYLGPFLKKPTLFTEHNTWNGRRDHAWLRPIERWCYRRIDKIVAISPATAISLEEWLGLAPSRVSVIANGIRLDRFDRIPRIHTGDRVVIGMAARFSREKDHPTLLRALAILPSNYRLKLAGDGPLRKPLQELAAQLGVLDRIEFLGVVADMPAFYRSIDIYVQSSNCDGFSLVAVEAMASGVPTIGSDIPGLRDTIGTPDLLFAHGDAQDLARRVRGIGENAANYASMARYCVERAGLYSIEKTAEQYAAAYEAVASKT